MSRPEPQGSPISRGSSVRIAGYDVCGAILSRFRLDGGAMFGSVPKALWERFTQADAKNRIALVARALVLRAPDRWVLIDAGMGNKFSSRDRDHFAIEEIPDDSLSFRWQELTDIVLTHLHFDHAGGISVWTEDPPGPAGARRARLRAPRARVHLDRENWLRAQSPGVRERASYLPENVEPLREADLCLSSGPAEILPGVRSFPSHGHTRGLQWLLIGEGRDALAFPADLVPTSAHVHLPFVMGYDMCVERLLSEKDDFLSRAAEEEWKVVFAHDPVVPVARIVRGKDGRYQIGQVLEI